MYNGAALAASDRFTHPAADVISSDHHPNSHTYLYTQPDIDVPRPTPFAQAISAAAGSAGIEETKPGGPEGAKFTSTFTWDSLTITTVFSPDECDAGCRGTFLYVTAPRVGTLPIHTASGIVVGQTVDEAKKRGAQPTPDLPLASDPEDPSLINSTTEGTNVVIPDADQGVIIGIRAGDWYTSLSGL